MSEKKEFDYGLWDENEMTVTLTLDDDSELECAVTAIFPVQGKDYIALLPLNGEAEVVWLYRIVDITDELQLENIEDDDEYEAVADAFDEMLDELEFEDMIEE